WSMYGSSNANRRTPLYAAGSATWSRQFAGSCASAPKAGGVIVATAAPAVNGAPSVPSFPAASAAGAAGAAAKGPSATSTLVTATTIPRYLTARDAIAAGRPGHGER